jgi:hypothetical protein
MQFAQQVAHFNQAKVGEVVIIQVYPEGTVAQLVKKAP